MKTTHIRVRGKIFIFLCGILSGALLCGLCFKPAAMPIYDYARKMENPDLFIRGDGSIWKIYSETEEKITLTYCGEYANVPITTAVKKKNADKMRLYEYMLASCENDDIFIRQDGGVYYAVSTVKYDLDDRWVTVSLVEPLGELTSEQLNPDMDFEFSEIGTSEISKQKYILFSVRNNSAVRYEVPDIYLSVYIDGEWYRVQQSRAGTLELWSLSPGYTKNFAIQLVSGGDYDEWISLPPGHYRAELHNHGTYPPQIDNCFCVFEFDLRREKGEYSVKY